MVWLDNIIRSLFALVDGILGWALGELYTLIVQIANVDVFGNYIYEFMGRIYVFLSIFMLFKLSISVVNYILNPDQLTDKTKGFSKIIQQVIIVMGLIVMTPQIFKWAYDLQANILNTNVLYTLVTGKPNTSKFSMIDYKDKTDAEIVAAIKEDSKEVGDMMKYNLLSSFIYKTDGKVGTERNSDYKTARQSKNCDSLAKDSQYGYGWAYDCLLDPGTILNKYTFNSDGYGANGKFVNEYRVLVSTICLGFAAYVFLVTTFDVALRCVKLGFLQLIAPIPIISMLDPNSAKNGMFSKWFKECKNNYLSLFTRLLVVYFAVEMIDQIFSGNSIVWYGTNTQVGFGFVKIFIVLGLLMFVKQLPKFIEDALGIKADAGGLNLKKKLDSIPGSKAVGTFGKKGIAGLDAMRNGKRFSEGWNKIEGTGPLAKFQKWKAGVMPYTAERKKNQREGRDEVSDLNEKWNQGKNVADKLGENWKKALDGRTKANYEKVFTSKNFISSKMNLDMANKDLEFKRQDNAEKSANGTLTRADVEALEKLEKKVSGLQKVHDSLRKVYWEDAEVEDAFKFYKSNEINPANIEQKHLEEPNQQQDSNSGVNATIPNYSTQEGAREWEQFDT